MHKILKIKIKHTVYCLTKNIYFEAGIESNYGKFAVAFTTLNRVRHKKFPNTICKVVFQSSRVKSRPKACQFSWSCDGKSDNPTSKKLWIISEKIALIALNFPDYDITNGSTHYHADYVNPIWAKSLTKTFKIGKHIFYK